ncbi:MAG: methyltransferase domain-containing protein [Anaerolineae bacterium]
MNDARDAVQALYRSEPDREWGRLARHPMEFAVTLRALDDHLPPPPADILDCGGGPGRYAVTLTRRGYNVTLFDLSPELIALARAKAEGHGVELAGYEQGTATDLSRFGADRFDAVLLMGPLYHLLEETERRQALAEAYRVVKPGGWVFAAFISRYAGHIDAAAHYPERAPKMPELYYRIAETGLLPPRANGSTGFTAYFAHPNEVRPLCRRLGLDVTALLAVEGVTSGREEKISALEGEDWQFWVDLNYKIAQDPSILGGTEHLLAVCRKPLWRRVLTNLARELDRANIAYKVVGGTSLALHGLDVPVNDLDLELPPGDIYRFQERFADYAIEPVTWRESDVIRSHFGRFVIDAVTVEAMASLERRTPDGRWVPSLASTGDTVEIDGTEIHVTSLEEEVLAYLRRGRLDRAALGLRACSPDRFRSLLKRAQQQNLF